MPKRRMPRHSVTQPEDQSIKLIPLTQGQNAIVDAADFEWLSQWNWCAVWCPWTKTYYAERKAFVDGKQSSMKMHRAILRLKSSEICDHKNHNTLDNRRENIRKCTASQNGWNRGKPADNTSGYKGVSRYRGRWRARAVVHGKEIHIGTFDTREQAADAYEERIPHIHGDFAFIPNHVPRN